MNKRNIIAIALLAIMQISSAQSITENLNVPWEKTNSLSYIPDFSGNYAVDVFCAINGNSYAFLSKTEKKILVFNSNTNQKLKEINLSFFPIDFTYSNHHYLVAGNNYLYTLNDNGKVIDKQFIGDRIIFTQAVKYINDKPYIITPDQTSWSFDDNKTIIKHDGIIIAENTWAKIEKINKLSFKIIFSKENNKSVEKIINTKENLGTVRILGLSNNNLLIEKQIITQEIPLKVTRKICFYSIKNFKKISEIELPDIAYTYIKHDVFVENDRISFLISTPESAMVYEMETSELKNKSISFPTELYQSSYHYNNHLVSIDEKDLNQSNNNKNTGAVITRQQIINNAEPYAVYNWTCAAVNIKDYDCGGVHVTTPSWVNVGANVSMPYMWGGFSSLLQFDQGINDGVSAGDSYTVGNGSGPGCAVGVDCSGYVSRAWDLPYKYGTSTLPNISTEYASFSQLLPGDIVNYAGHHVRLVHTLNTDGSFLLVEAAASATDWRVGYNNYTTADLQSSYIPRYYNDVIEDIAPPTTDISANLWQTQDFQASFTDDDDNNVNENFYHIANFDGTKWLANTDNGFLYDNFSTGIYPYWIQVGSTWTNTNEAIEQSDEANSNTNIYANLNQQDGNIYLYNWRMKISGTGTNRRAGIYFMCDDATQTQRNNSYMIYFRADQNKCQIYKSVSNSIDIKTDDDCIVNADEWFDAKIIYNTNNGIIKVYKNDTLVSSWTDGTPLTSGNAMSLRTGNASVSYDDFVVYRSRTDVATISVGANSDAPYQSINTAPACFIKSIVTDMAGNFSTTATKYINIDWTKPTLSTIADGLSSDIDSTINTSELSANWVSGNDANSGILEYYYCFGTSPFSNNIVSWTNNGNNLNFTETALSLDLGTTYYVSIKAVNNAGLVSDSICSDGNKLVIFVSSDKLNINDGLNIYPIPAKDYITISTSNKVNILLPEIYNLSGKKLSTNIAKNMQNSMIINTSKLQNGIYILKFNINGKTVSKQFIIKR